MVWVTLIRLTVPVEGSTNRCWRGEPSLLSTLTLPEEGTYATGLIPQISKPRTSCSPPM